MGTSIVGCDAWGHNAIRARYEAAMNDALNVLGGPLETCSTAPMTGYFRDGCCRTDESDRGSHTLCAQVTEEFLAFSRARGNDLTTPNPAFGFPGLKPGDRWCLCVTRWKEAYLAGAAPRVYLVGTHERALDVVTMEELAPFAIDSIAFA